MPRSQDFVFLTGLSGAGKSTALKSFEDLGFFCIDNLPPVLIPIFIDLCHSSTEEVKKVAIGIDGEHWVIVYQHASNLPISVYEFNSVKNEYNSERYSRRQLR